MICLLPVVWAAAEADEGVECGEHDGEAVGDGHGQHVVAGHRG